MKIRSKARHLGARELRAIKIEGRKKKFLHTAQGDALRLFLMGLMLGEVEQHVCRLEELGVADVLLARAQGGERGIHLPLEHERRICAALGVKAASIERFEDGAPSEWRTFGPREAEAWFLVNFAWFYSKMVDESMSINGRLQMAIALGRLLEWWHWRTTGLDRMAAAKKRSEAARPRATAARKAKAASDPPDWWADAREQAAGCIVLKTPSCPRVAWQRNSRPIWIAANARYVRS